MEDVISPIRVQMHLRVSGKRRKAKNHHQAVKMRHFANVRFVKKGPFSGHQGRDEFFIFHLRTSSCHLRGLLDPL
jgi:hypothetical protein